MKNLVRFKEFQNTGQHLPYKGWHRYAQLHGQRLCHMDDHTLAVRDETQTAVSERRGNVL